MSQKPTRPQQGTRPAPQPQQQGETPRPAPQQGETPVFRDWASI
jgi:hypothetical protein